MALPKIKRSIVAKKVKRTDNKYRPRIPFSEWFPKIEHMEVGRVFHTIRFIDKKDWYCKLAQDRQEVRIFVRTVGHSVGYAEVIGVAVMKIEGVDEKIIRADTYEHWDKEAFFKLLEKFYWRRDDWDGIKSEIIIIFLKTTETFKKGAMQSSLKV